MTDLVRYENPTNSIELAGTAWPIAQQIARTEFVPAALRGKPEAVLACIMTGHELGIGAMQSLAKIHVIEGRPSMAAELMRAVILQHGHEFWIEESSNTRVTVGGQRAGSTRETKITWTLDDAKRAGLEGRQNWRKFPRAMLLARATAELARAMFADVLAGISYTMEELTDGEFIDGDGWAAPVAVAQAEPTPPAADTAKKVAAKRPATRKAAAPRPAPARGEAPPLPGEEDDRPPVDEAGEEDPEPGDTHTETEARPLSGPAAIAVALKEKGFEDRDDKLRIVSDIVQRPVESTKDLDPKEVSLVLATIGGLERADLEEMAAAPAEVVTEPPATPARIEPTGTGDEEAAWDADAWRSFLSSRKVKVVELLREANRYCVEQDVRPPGTLDDLSANAELAVHLRGYVEDLALERSGS